MYVAPGDASFERTYTAPVDRVVAWDWLTDPGLRARWNSDGVIRVTPGGREAAAVTNHRLHGPDVVVEHVEDWRPFDYFTKRYEFPGVGWMSLTTELTDHEAGTTIAFRGERLAGERLEAWRQIEAGTVGGLEYAAAELVEQLNRLAAE